MRAVLAALVLVVTVIASVVGYRLGQLAGQLEAVGAAEFRVGYMTGFEDAVATTTAEAAR